MKIVDTMWSCVVCGGREHQNSPMLALLTENEVMQLFVCRDCTDAAQKKWSEYDVENYRRELQIALTRGEYAGNVDTQQLRNNLEEFDQWLSGEFLNKN